MHGIIPRALRKFVRLVSAAVGHCTDVSMIIGLLGHKGHFSLSGGTLVNSSIGRLFLPRPSESSANRDPSKRRRVRAEKHMRHLLHSPKPGSTAAEAVWKRKPESEVVDQREEDVQISDLSHL